MMPIAEPAQEALPDFSTHPDYQLIFGTLVAGGQNRDQATLLLADLWHKRTNNVVPQPKVGTPLEPCLQQQRLQQRPGGEEQRRSRRVEQDELQQPDHAQPPHDTHPPHQYPSPNHEEQLGPQHRDHQHGHAPHLVPPGAPLAPQDVPPLLIDNYDWPTQDKADKRVPQLLPIDPEAESRTMSPTTYAIEMFRKFEYVPLWYFTEQGCQVAGKDKASNEDRDVTKTSDNRVLRRTAAFNRPSPHALSDEQLTWEQFMDANHLLCRWLIPAGWPEGYAEVLSSFFWRIENHEDKYVAGGKEALLLYQARVPRAWHDELKAGHFFNLAKLDDKKLNACFKEVDAKHNAMVRKAVMALLTTPPQANLAGKAKRQRARDTNSKDSAYSSRHHPYKRTTGPTRSFRPSSTEQPQTLCVVCLRKLAAH